MSKRVIYRNPDGSVSVVTPAAQSDVAKVIPAVGNLTEAQFLNWVSNKDIPSTATNVIIIEEENLPPRANRNLWRWDGERITVNGVSVSTPSGVKIR
jgi:hypothetical protein